MEFGGSVQACAHTEGRSTGEEERGRAAVCTRVHAPIADKNDARTIDLHIA